MRLHFQTSPTAHPALFAPRLLLIVHFACFAPLLLPIAPHRIWGRIPRPPPLHCHTCRKRPLCFSPLEVIKERSTIIARRLSPLSSPHKHHCVNPPCKSYVGKFAAGMRAVVNYA